MRSVVAKLCRLNNGKPGCTGARKGVYGPLWSTEDGGPNRPMNDVVSLQDYRDGKQKALKTGHLDAVKDGLRARGASGGGQYLSTGELSTLLSLYSEQVAAGHWRDYAIDSLPGQALFSVYRSAYENPDFVIAKQIAANGKGREFVVYQGPKRVMRSETLAEVLRHFEPLRERARLRLRSF